MTKQEKQHLLIMMKQTQQSVYLSIGGFAKLMLTAFIDVST